MNGIVRGLLTGLAATAVMSGLMAAAKLTGLMEEAPPEQITSRIGHKIGINPAKKGRQAFTPTWLAAHVTFGAGCGVVYELFSRLIPGNAVVRGLIFGEAVWATSYLKLLPEMGLYPTPESDSNSRVAVMVVAHAIYGTTLATLEEELHRRNY